MSGSIDLRAVVKQTIMPIVHMCSDAQIFYIIIINIIKQSRSWSALAVRLP